METELLLLKKQLAEKDEEISGLKKKLLSYETPTEHKEDTDLDKLSNASIKRYSRQLILPEIGVKGQILLQKASVLIVGCGGLGCPSAVYLAAAGIGRLGLVDHDEVEISNLHRQVLHTEQRVGMSKASSVAIACNQLNSLVKCVPHQIALYSSNALEIIKQYDIVIDATDNVATRYLLNDACVLAGKPLVSGSALRFEGQLTVYNHKGGPCYRCLFPTPPPPHTVTNCSDGGVLGVVPGIIGCLQALETIKTAANFGDVYSGRLLMFDGQDGSVRSVRLRGRQAGCAVCGDSPTITKLIDYEQFCGAKATDKDKSISVLNYADRISVKEYKQKQEEKEPHLLVDVRLPVEMEICSLPDYINIPMDQLGKAEPTQKLKDEITATLKSRPDYVLPVYVVCRRGNDSQLAVNIFKDLLKDMPVSVKDLRGGLHAWAKHIDSNFPVY